MKYHAEYVSSTVGQTGCVKRFATVAQGNLEFPPQVSYRCDLCEKEHGFRLVRTYSTATKQQEQQFLNHCQANDIEPEVELL